MALARFLPAFVLGQHLMGVPGGLSVLLPFFCGLPWTTQTLDPLILTVIALVRWNRLHRQCFWNHLIHMISPVCLCPIPFSVENLCPNLPGHCRCRSPWIVLCKNLCHCSIPPLLFLFVVCLHNSLHKKHDQSHKR